MPFRLTILPAARVGLAVGFGSVSGDDLAEACGAMIYQADWGVGFDEIWDLSETTVVDVTPDALDGLIETMRSRRDLLGEGRVACVTTRDSVAVLIRLIETLTLDLGRTFQTVHTRAEAAEWLGLDPAALEDVRVENATGETPTPEL